MFSVVMLEAEVDIQWKTSWQSKLSVVVMVDVLVELAWVPSSAQVSMTMSRSLMHLGNPCRFRPDGMPVHWLLLSFHLHHDVVLLGT